LELDLMGKMYKGFRFDPELYADFRKLASSGGCTVTGAFERFMKVRVDGGVLVFPESGVGSCEVEARVLVDWSRKGRRFYRGENGEEVNIPGRLLWLLHKVHDVGFKAEMEDELKRSASKEE
jgi:hypothetical protein